MMDLEKIWFEEMQAMIEKYKNLEVPGNSLLNWHLSFIVAAIANSCSSEKEFKETFEGLANTIKQTAWHKLERLEE